MKPKAARRKRARKTRPARKSVRIHLAGRCTYFFKRKNSFWKIGGINRVYAALGMSNDTAPFPARLLCGILAWEATGAPVICRFGNRNRFSIKNSSKIRGEIFARC